MLLHPGESILRSAYAVQDGPRESPTGRVPASST